MTTWLQVEQPGLLTTVQDLGRPGFGRFGVSAGGAMDRLALRIANRLVGNRPDAAALEITLVGPLLRFEHRTRAALCGADLRATIDGIEAPMWRPFVVEPGAALAFGDARRGCRAYVAVAGGIDVPVVMGSRATDLLGGFGGVDGRELRRGDRVPVGPDVIPEPVWLADAMDAGPFRAPRWLAAAPTMAPMRREPVVRVVTGEQADRFSRDSRRRLTTEPYLVTARSDRMGCRLKGPVLRVEEPGEMVSEPVAFGSIQVTPDGGPIVLMADRPPTGGYPKIACAASVDLPLLAQLPPGGRVRFRTISHDEARALVRERERELALLNEGLTAHGA